MRGRFAPSPTGSMHLGNVRSALLGWLWARSSQGTFLLRIEDLDRARCRPGMTEQLFRDLEYLGLDWDEKPLIQSERAALYDLALEELIRRGLVYPCFCTRTEIAMAASAPHGPSDDGPRYPGTCAFLSEAERQEKAATRTPALRFRASGLGENEVEFVDLLRGPMRQNVAQLVGDFVVRRNDGVASYQLAVVVDDAASQVTHILRGDDLLSSTPRQLLLYDALEKPRPLFAHVPLLMGTDGKRLAKRSGAFAISELRQARVPAEKIIGLLAGLSGLGDFSPRSAASLLAEFQLERLSKSATIADLDFVQRQLQFTA